jgi:hypothetical protein
MVRFGTDRRAIKPHRPQLASSAPTRARTRCRGVGKTVVVGSVGTGAFTQGSQAGDLARPWLRSAGRKSVNREHPIPSGPVLNTFAVQTSGLAVKDAVIGEGQEVVGNWTSGQLIRTDCAQTPRRTPRHARHVEGRRPGNGREIPDSRYAALSVASTGSAGMPRIPFQNAGSEAGCHHCPSRIGLRKRSVTQAATSFQ